ncbi:hypothetical protein WN943_021945 [Citrus x changshan-huyou]
MLPISSFLDYRLIFFFFFSLFFFFSFAFSSSERKFYCHLGDTKAPDCGNYDSQTSTKLSITTMPESSRQDPRGRQLNGYIRVSFFQSLLSSFTFIAHT